MISFTDFLKQFSKIIKNVQIPQTIAIFMGVNNFGDQTNFKALEK